jgi:tetratricopeptide (TPR) repeat protein
MNRDEQEAGMLEGDEVFATAAAAVRADASDEGAWDQLEELAAASQRPDEVGALYREILDRKLPPDTAALVGQRAVQFHEEWFREDSPNLVAVLQRVLAIDPSASEWAFQRLTVVFTVGERWDELLALYDREIAAAADEHRRASLLEEAAQTAKDFAGAPDRAASYLQQLLPLRRGDKQLVSNLERLLERQERYADLVALWRDQLPSQPKPRREVRHRIAEHLYEKLGRAEEATAELRAMLDEGGDPTPALQMLEKIARDQQLPAEARREALGLLRERYDAEDRTTAVIATLDTALELADVGERITLHRDAAQRLRTAGVLDEALEHLGAVLVLAPDDEEALVAAREVAEQAGTPRRLVDLLVAAADAVEAVAERAPLRLEAAERLVTLGEPQAAIPQLQLLADEPDVAPGLAMSASRLLVEQLGATGRTQEQLAALDRLATLEDTPSRRRQALAQAAELAASLGDADRALALHERCLVEDPSDSAALGAIVDLLEREERWSALVRALRRREGSTSSAWQKRADLVRIARVQSERLAQPADAIATWTEVGAVYGEDAEVADALTTLFERTERYEEMAAVLDRTAQREDAHLADVRARQGSVFATYLGDASRALSSFRRALEASPTHEAAREGLAVLCEDPSVAADAVEALARSYERTGEWEPRLALLEPRLASASDVATRVRLLREAAELQEREARAPGAALRSIARAFVLAPDDLRLEAEVERLAEAAGAADELADAFAHASAGAEGARRATLAARESEVRQDALEDLSGAFDACARALAAAPLREEYADRLLALAERTGRWEETAQALTGAADAPFAPPSHVVRLAAAQRHLSPAALLPTLLRLAELAPNDLDSLHEAAKLAPSAARELATSILERLFERAAGLWRRGASANGSVAADAAATWAAESLVARYDAEGREAEVVPLLVEVARLPMNPVDAATWRKEAARRAEARGDRATAMELYRDVVKGRDDAEALRRLGDLLAAEGRRAELLGLRQKELTVTHDPERRVAVRLEIASLVTEIEERGGRMEALRANLEERPGHEASLVALERLLGARRAHLELADLFASQADRLEGERAAQLWRRAAALAEAELSDLDRAVTAFRKVVELVPDDVPALDALARIHRSRGEAAAAARWLDRRLAVASASERADIAGQLAHELVSAGRLERAVEVLNGALDAAPARQDLRDLLVAQLRALSDHDALARALAASAEHVEPERALDLVRESAALYRDVLHRPADAIPVLRKGLALSPDDRAIKLQLAEGLREGGELAEARTLLEEVVEGFGRRRSPERADVHYQLGTVAKAQGDVEGALEQFDLATKMAMAEPRMLDALGRLAREAGQLDRAEKAYRALLMTVRRRGPTAEVDVGSGEVLFELHAIANARGEAEQAAELLESALEAAAQNDAEALRFRDALLERGEPDLALRGLERRVKLADEPASKATVLGAMAQVLARSERTAEAYERRLQALSHDASSVELQKAALRDARALGRVPELSTALARLLEVHKRDEDAALQATLWMRLGEIAEQDEGDLEKATSAYSRAEANAASPAEAWIALARVGAVREDHALQRRVLPKLVELPELSTAARTSALHQLAQVLLREAQRDAEQLDGAVAIARRAFDADPRHASLAGALDAVVARHATHDGAMKLYAEVALDSGDDALALTFLERRAHREDATLAQVREAADRALGMRASSRAEVLLQRALGLANAADDVAAARNAMRQLADLRREANDPSGALAWMQKAVETATDDDERRAMQRELAEVAAGEGGDLEVAAETYRALLEVDPVDESLWRPLLAVQLQRGDEDGLNDLVSQLLDGLLDPALRNEARLAKARFLMSLEGREFDAVELLKDALGEEPGHPEAAELLGRLYEKSGYDEDLVELLQQQLDVARDNQDLGLIVELTLKLGALLEKVRRDDALDVYRRGLDWVPTDRSVIESYLAMLGPDDDARERAEVREKLLGIEVGDAASRLARELYAEWEALEDPDGTLRALALGYRGNPEDAGLRESLEARYRANEDWAALADFLGTEATRLAGSDPDGAITRLREAARLRREMLGDSQGAIDALRRAYAQTGSPDLLDELVAALEGAGDLEGAAREVSAALEAQEARDATWAKLLGVRARLRAAAGDTVAALVDLETAYAVAPGDLSEALARTLAQRQSEVSHDAEAERPVLWRRVDVLEAARSLDDARDALADWCARETTDRDALLRLRTIDLRLQNWSGVVATSDALVRVLEHGEQVEAAMLLVDAAEALESPGLARDGLEHVFSVQPRDERVIERLRGLYEAIGAGRELATLLAHEASMADAERAFELYRRAGRVLVEVGDPDGALPMLQRAVDAKPDDHATIVLLADAYIGGGYYAEAGQLLETSIQNHPRRRSPELAELQQRMSRLAQVAGDRNLEMQWLNAAMESDKNNVEIASELAWLSYELGEHEIALGALRAVTLAKNDGPMSKAMAFLLQAKIAHVRGEGRRALLWARKAKQEDPALPEVDQFLAELGDV